MSTVHKHLRRTLAAVCLCCLLLSFAFAQGLSADSEYVFSGTEFGEDAAECGIFVEQAPDAACCGLYLGSRLIRAGDFLPAQALRHLVLRPAADTDAVVCIGYRPVIGNALGESCQFTMSISSTKDDAPMAQDGTLKTYRNIANSGKLNAEDPEGLAVCYRIEAYPKRGTVELHEDGTFVYTPRKNKVGEDSFTFTAADPAGNISDVKTIRIEILKPADAATFSDLNGQAQFTAMWMRESGLYGGEVVADELCFCPEKSVTRGEFLVMAMKLAGIQPEIGLLTSGFADQDTAPNWMQTYLVSAMRRGFVQGVSTQDGLYFLPNAPITASEAAQIVCNIFGLEKAQSVGDFEADLPVWAAASVAAVRQAGFTLPDGSSTLSRLDAATLFYGLSELK